MLSVYNIDLTLLRWFLNTSYVCGPSYRVDTKELDYYYRMSFGMGIKNRKVIARSV